MKSLSIGVVCYPTYGGSGVIAAEAGMELARRGHRVHFVSYDIPRRLDHLLENVYFHEVEAAGYPLFQEPHYALALASKLVSVSREARLDVVHVHYAIPHAVSAYLACQMLGADAPKVVTTLHGTDITLVGSDPSYLPMTRFSIERSDAVTAVSKFLRDATYRELGVPRSVAIEVIPNFVDLEVFHTCRAKAPRVRSLLCREFECEEPFILTHISNFRPVKRVEDLIHVVHKIWNTVPVALVLVGDGPDRPKVEKLARELGVDGRVCFLGKQDSVAEVLSGSDLFLLSSETESFGLGLLEAMASGVPVVATGVGGVPEVVTSGEQGLLVPLGDLDGFASAVISLLKDDVRRKAMGEAGRRLAEERYDMKRVVGLYEELYRQLV